MLSREFTNPVFTDVAFSASHTYSHWTDIGSPRNTRSAEKGGQKSPASQNPLLQREDFFIIILFRYQPKKHEKTDGSDVLAGGTTGLSSYVIAYSKF